MKLSKGKLSIFIISVVVFSAFSILGIVYYLGNLHTAFFGTATMEFEIPGLEEDFVPQGMEYVEANNSYLISGYMGDGSPSRIYMVEESGVKYVTLEYQGENYIDHAGGVTSDGEGLWVVGDGMVNYLSFSDVMNAENGEKVEITSRFESYNGADFVTIYQNYLIVGEFHREGNYSRDESHEITTPSGKINKAVTFAYEINNGLENGIASTQPSFAISTTSLVQGMAFTSDKIILSTSYSLPNSNIYTYENIITSASDIDEYQFEGIAQPVSTYVLNEPISTVSAPSMSEEITINGDKLYILFENACNKYKLFTNANLTNVYSYPLENL